MLRTIENGLNTIKHALDGQSRPEAKIQFTSLDEGRYLVYRLLETGKYDQIGAVQGISIVRGRNTFDQRRVNCLVYVFGIQKSGNREIVSQEGYAESEAHRVISQSEEVSVARAG